MSRSTDNPTDSPSGHDLLSRAQASAHWSAERLHADVHRVVGGPLNLVREVSRISHHLEGSITAEWMCKRVQFLAYELQALVPQAISLPESERLHLLNRFFFESKKFRCVEPSKLLDHCEAFRLNRVLITRTGAPIVLELLYAFLAEKIGVSLDFVDLKPLGFLRWKHEGRARYIDITRSGAVLSNDEMIETLHSRFQMTSVCNASLLEALSFESFVTDYVMSLKLATDLGHEPEQILFLQDTLIAYQPSNLALIGERALLHRRLGNFKSALADLKRYFAFHDKRRAPAELSRLYDELTGMLERRPEPSF